MNKICLVLKQVVDALDDIPLPEHDFITHGHELILHVGFKSVYDVYSPVEHLLEKPFGNVAPVSEDLSEEVFRQHAPYASVPVVDVSPCETEC